MTEQPWSFLPENEIPEGFVYPRSYLAFIDGMQSHNGAMLGLYPWVFAGEKIWAKNESLEFFGTQLVPFAQAELMDVMAYFEVSDTDEPRVWVCNPWEALPELRIYEKLNSFLEWVIYAKKVSEEQLELKPHFRNDEFWFPK